MINCFFGVTKFLVELLKIDIIARWFIRCPYNRKYKWRIVLAETILVAIEYGLNLNPKFIEATVFFAVPASVILALKKKKQYMLLVFR